MFTTKAAHWGARSGTFAINGKEIPTPNFIVSTTRGSVDHLTPDHAPCAPISGIYAEEFIDREDLAEKPFSRKCQLPLRSKLTLGCCRRPGSRKIANKPNTLDSIAIDTNQGSRLADIKIMTDFMSELKPDMFLIPSDDPAQSTTNQVGMNRLRKMHMRSLDWMERFSAKRLEMGLDSSNLFFVARILPELRTAQYLSDIGSKCDAYCFTPSEVSQSNYIPHELVDAAKMRISDQPNATWRDVLNQVAEGTDLVYVPLTSFTDAGLALQLSWLAAGKKEMHWNLADPKYTTDMNKLGETGHSLAYICHLLNAREMTAKVLLQQHNMLIIERLFEDIRRSINAGTFEEDQNRFFSCYDM